MKIILSAIILILSISTFSLASGSPSRDENLHIIMDKTFIKDPELNQLFYMIAAKKIGDSGKNIEVEALIEKLHRELRSEENLKKLSKPYTNRYNEVEIEQIRTFLQSPVFDKYNENAEEVTKESIQILDSILDDILKTEEGEKGKDEKAPAIIKVTKENFVEEVQNSKVPVVIDCYADWCGPCKSMHVLIQSLNKEYNGRIKFTLLDIEDQKEIAEKFKVEEPPVLFFIKNGKVMATQEGFAEKDVIKKKIEENLK